MHTYRLIGLAAALGLVAACGNGTQTPAPESETSETAMAESETASVSLAEIVAGDQRPEGHSVRDGARHPVETLEFFGLEPDMTVVEIWPGGGWYTHIIAPYLATGGGSYYAAGFEIGDSEGRRQYFENFKNSVSDEAVYGDVNFTVLSATSEGVAPEGSADMVLTFRNIHNWMNGGFAGKAFEDFYAALKPGGVLGVVEHRLPEGAEQDPSSPSGYVSEQYVIEMAEAAGFQFVESSEINANPADTADHPFGVWTLPPTLRTSHYGQEPDSEFDSEPYRAIGESDRMTLKFTKPVTADGAMLE